MEKMTLRDAIDASNKIEKFLDTMFQYFESQKYIERGYQSKHITTNGSAISIILSYGRSNKVLKIENSTLIEKAFSIFVNGGASIMEFNDLLSQISESVVKSTENAYKG
jgi:hypothetical protein